MFQAALEVIELVQTRNQDKPKIFIDWAESLVINALECVLNSSMPKVSGSEHQSMSKFSFGYSLLFSFLLLFVAILFIIFVFVLF